MGRFLKTEQLLPADVLVDASIAAEEERGIQLQQQIARNILQYRDMRGLSVESLAQQAGVETAALRAVESAEAMPSVGLLWKVARVLDVSCLALTGEPGEPIAMSHRPGGEASLLARR